MILSTTALLGHGSLGHWVSHVSGSLGPGSCSLLGHWVMGHTKVTQCHLCYLHVHVQCRPTCIYVIAKFGASKNIEN